MLSEFFIVATLHILAVMSPGPDFALILRQSVRYGRYASILTSAGIAIGILFHVLYCIIGLSLIISQNNNIFNFIKTIGALYLIYLGCMSLKTLDTKIDKKESSSLRPFMIGLATNILNPKATLFFLSLYSFILSQQPSIQIQFFYGVWMSIITFVWFLITSIALTSEILESKIRKFSKFCQIGAGLMLILFGINILFFN